MRKTRFQRNEHPALRPGQTDGHVYYVRLKTPLGLFYKLGFTTLGSVAERLAYQGAGDERLIDEVLLFVYMPDGYDVETALHRHFKARALTDGMYTDPNLPLQRNGQSELYFDDILGLDPAYHIDQAHATRDGIRRAEQSRVDEIVRRMGGPKPSDPDVEQVMSVIEDPVRWMMRAYLKFCMIFASESERMRQAAHQGRHYQIKIEMTPQIESILSRLTEAKKLADKTTSRKERQEKLKQLMLEAGISDLPSAPRV
jgi:hypothetical protein